ncbi:MAG: SDR family oxidoreductase [Bryobacteraceae bacterium]
MVLITGANGGLGAAVTNAFLDAGAVVFGAARRISESEFGNRPSFHAISTEIASPGDAEILSAKVADAGGRIDALVHLVGGFSGGERVEDTSAETMGRMMEINYGVAFHLLRAVLPMMRRQGGGSVVGIGSRSAEQPSPQMAAYAASKAALVSLMRSAAAECRGAGVRVNVVSPGTMDTPANRAANPGAAPTRWVRPEQVAALVVHLTSAAASQISGAVIPVYGEEL